MRLTRVLVLRVQKVVFCKESFVVACLTYKNVQRFQNEPVHKFYSLKTSQMLVLTNTHTLEEIKNLCKQLDSDNTHGSDFSS